MVYSRLARLIDYPAIVDEKKKPAYLELMNKMKKK